MTTKTTFKISIFIICFVANLSYPFNIYGQEYQTYSMNRTVLFANNSNEIKAMRIDSTALAIDSIYYPMKNIRENGFMCFNFNGASWIGDKIILKNIGENIFFNMNSDSIIIKTTAPLNESWICYEQIGVRKIKATVTNISYELVLNVMDSVKTISLQMMDASNTNISHSINSKQIKLSQNHGIVTSLNFYFFPDLQSYSPMLNEVVDEFYLIGTNNPLMGVQNLKWVDVFDFDIHDEIHSEYYFMLWYFPVPTQVKKAKEIRRILEKTIILDTINYLIERKREQLQISLNDTIKTLIWDTIPLQVTNNILFDMLPGAPVRENEESYIHTMNNLTHISKTVPSVYERFVSTTNDSCLYQIIADGCFPSYTYLKGLGGPYYCCSYIQNEIENNLVYYKKGTTTWGMPLDINVNIENKTPSESLYKIYPNIVDRQFTISTTKTSLPYRFKLYNINGQILMDMYIYSNIHIIENIDGLKGMYLYNIIDSEGYRTSGKIVFL